MIKYVTAYVVERVRDLVKFGCNSILWTFLGCVFYSLFSLILALTLGAGGLLAWILGTVAVVVVLSLIGLGVYECFLIYETIQIIKNSELGADNNREAENIYNANCVIMISYVLCVLGITLPFCGIAILAIKIYIYFQYQNLKENISRGLV